MSELFLHVSLQKQEKNHHFSRQQKNPRINTTKIFLMIMVIKHWNMAN